MRLRDPSPSLPVRVGEGADPARHPSRHPARRPAGLRESGAMRESGAEMGGRVPGRWGTRVEGLCGLVMGEVVERWRNWGSGGGRGAVRADLRV